ncbi:uncharacterized protein DNG_05956 [Cephalotrichum gorgonifer]|uniref:Uncharacterized protein n=1 Tax=Cephalotrichum gorgonifer TaxID=2041049 RepID=A0AAE8N0K7_9PEZI|nr:uncharacterized protein DNG_05956 [Cephalotrichum gorgonifer]
MLTQISAIPVADADPVAEPDPEPRQDAFCTVVVGSCNEQPIELGLTECACACVQASCDEAGGCEAGNGTPFKQEFLGGAFNECIAVSQCIPMFAEGQELEPSLINCGQ